MLCKATRLICIPNVDAGPVLQVQAHGGALLKVKDTWYWCGESYKRPLLGDFLSEGVNLYSSTGEGPLHACFLSARWLQAMDAGYQYVSDACHGPHVQT